EIPSPVAGTIQKIVAEEDETVDVGATLAVIGDGSAGSGDSDEADAAPAEEPAAEAEPAVETPAPAAPSSGDTGGSGGGKGTDVVMPELGESVTEGTITKWLKAVGDTVEVDEPLLEVSTDK